MAKPISKMGSRKNGCIGSRKHARKIPKEIIHVQASFNNSMIKGPGLGRDAALRAIRRSGILFCTRCNSYAT